MSTKRRPFQLTGATCSLSYYVASLEILQKIFAFSTHDIDRRRIERSNCVKKFLNRVMRSSVVTFKALTITTTKLETGNIEVGLLRLQKREKRCEGWTNFFSSLFHKKLQLPDWPTNKPNNKPLTPLHKTIEKNKQQFWSLVQLSHNCSIANLPTQK